MSGGATSAIVNTASQGSQGLSIEKIDTWFMGVPSLGKAGAFEPFFKLFEHPSVALFLSLAILIVAVYYGVKAHFQFRSVSRVLGNIEPEVRKYGSYKEFSENYAEVNELFENVGFLKHSWDEFTETLILPGEGDEPVVRNTARPHHYINLGSAQKAGMSLRFYQALPNYFVGFGLLFTFLGLVAALYFASQGVGGADVEKAQQALKKLLHAATFKFSTSIAGLAASLILGISIKRSIAHLEKQYNALADALEHQMLWIFPEKIAVDHLREAEELNRQMARFNDDFAIQVAQELEKKITGGMSGAMEPLAAAMDKMTTQMSSMNQDALSDMTSKFSESIQQGAGKEMEALVKGLDGIRVSLSEMNENINRSGDTFGQQMDQTSERLKGMFSDAGSEFVDQLSQAGSNVEAAIAPFVSGIGHFSRSLEGLDDRLEQQGNAMGELLGQINEAASTLKSSAISMREAGQPVAQAVERLESTAADMAKTSENVSKTHTSIQEMAQQLDRSIEVMRSSWSEYETRFSDVDESLAKIFEQLIDGSEAFRNRVQEFVVDVDKQMANAVSGLSSGVQNLNDAVEELSEVLEEKRAA